MKVLERTGYGLAAIGLVGLALVALAPLGLVRAYPEPPQSAIDGPLGLTREITDVRSLDQQPGEPLPDYLDRLTTAVADGIVHYWIRGDVWTEADSAYTAVSVWDNYVLWLMSLLPQFSANLTNYEFMSPDKAIARGYGFCSQSAKILYSILTAQGIDATIYTTTSHTVLEANGSVLDADYGVFVPHTLAEMQANPELVDQYYGRFGSMLGLLRAAYADTWKPLGDLEVFSSARDDEQWAERAKWWPPIMVMLIGLALIGAARATRKDEAPRRLAPAGGSGPSSAAARPGPGLRRS